MRRYRKPRPFRGYESISTMEKQVSLNHKWNDNTLLSILCMIDNHDINKINSMSKLALAVASHIQKP